ncbi:MAG: ferredoxin [Candidatus Pacebacteria bacterium]|nr:ferredoxin [Candidatus Paceibacterota bacterium]
MPDITFRINRQKVTAPEGANLLEIIQTNQIELPDLCQTDDRGQTIHTCLVELDREKEVKPAHQIKVKTDLRVSTNSGWARQQRQEAYLLIEQYHQRKCDQCQTGQTCELMVEVKKLQEKDLADARTGQQYSLHRMTQAAELDATACIGCNKCVEACQKVGIDYLHLEGEGRFKHIQPSQDPQVDCIYCGQCTVSCPVKAAREQSQLQQVEQVLADQDLITIVQMAPSVRASIGEEFGAQVGLNLEKKMFTAFRQLGFDYVFDVNMGADITTLVEAEELVDRLQQGGTLPMFTSCCPAWVKFVEFYYPEMIPHLTDSRSPQIHAGAAYKTWWAQKVGLDPKKMRVVSIMPCTSKKYEARHQKLMVDEMWPVDYVLTTRETASLLKKNKIELLELSDGELDEYGQYTGAAAIYGASGGVMESALRTAAHLIEGRDLPKLEFEQVRGMEGIKKAELELGGQTLRVAVVQMAGNMHQLIKEIKDDPEAYHYVEFMACPGGCIGGGGQPIPADDEKTAKRIEGLYQIDNQMHLRQAHQNQIAREFVEYANSQPEEKKQALLYTHYQAKQKGE